MSIGIQFAEFMRENAHFREGLSLRLAIDRDEIQTYYLCPISNLPSILETGLSCRNGVEAATDISAPVVQGRRGPIWLGRGGPARIQWIRDVEPHACINTFWNPFNSTLFAFQRNALLSSNEDGDRHVCILEVDASRILREGDHHWCASDGNISKAGTHTYCKLEQLENIDWDDVFLVPGDETRATGAQASEFLIHSLSGDPRVSRRLSADYISRILVPPGSTPDFNRLGVDATTEADVFSSVDQLLKAERWFVRNLRQFSNANGLDYVHVVATIALLERVERLVGDDLSGLYADEDSAGGWHGYSHTARVMFWSAFLILLEEDFDSPLARAAVVAALLHDSARQNDQEDSRHGKDAVQRHRNLILRMLPETDARAYCEDAIRSHCFDQEDETSNPVLRVLKDADGLERGRFTAAVPTNARGCNQSYLRTDCIASDQTRGLEWAAFWLASCTKTRNVEWTRQPCSALADCLFESLDIGYRYQVLTGVDGAFARAIADELE